MAWRQQTPARPGDYPTSDDVSSATSRARTYLLECAVLAATGADVKAEHFSIFVGAKLFWLPAQIWYTGYAPLVQLLTKNVLKIKKRKSAKD